MRSCHSNKYLSIGKEWKFQDIIERCTKELRGVERRIEYLKNEVNPSDVVNKKDFGIHNILIEIDDLEEKITLHKGFLQNFRGD